MDDAKKMQLIEELSKAVNPEDNKNLSEDDRVRFLQSTRTLEIAKEAKLESEGEIEEKKPTEEEAFEDLIQKLNEQKQGKNKR